MDETKKAWVAGLFDGEGCVLTRWPKKREATLEIKMVHKPSLERLISVVGGNLTRRIKNGGFGKRTQWRWRVSDAQAVAVGKMMLPYLCEKKEQVEALIAFKEATDNESRTKFAGMVKSLKHIEFDW